MMAIFNTCCGCCGIRVGVIILAVLAIIDSLCQFYCIKIGLDYAERNFGKYDWVDHLTRTLKAWYAFAALSLVTAILLLVCASLNKAKYKIMALVWAGWIGIYMLIIVAYSIIGCVWAKENWIAIVAIINGTGWAVTIAVLLILVVVSYYQQLRETEPEAMSLVDREKPQGGYSEKASV